ncbi:MAG TPA: Fur family transcriptional regulator [Acetobacteraceae bacterium]|nr:Fur family transcriptional regulator [Acetobacteraceae bacterium]
MPPLNADDIDGRLDHIAATCERQGVRFTDLRRAVLGLILASPEPLTAYALLDRLKETHRTAAPPTVYRALDFLLEQRLIHRVERLNAFIGCTDAEAHDHPAQFLICRLCGAVTELEDPAVLQALAQAAARTGFRLERMTVEIEGTCARCAA